MNAVYNELTGQWEEVPYSEEQASSGPVPTKPPAANPPDKPGTSDPNPPIIHEGTTTTAGPVDKHGNPKPREDDYTYFELEDGEWVGKSKHPELKIPTTTFGGSKVGAAGVGIGPDYSHMLPYPEWQSAGPFTPRHDTEDFEPFSYEKFAPTSYDDLEAQPGFADSQTRLRKQIEAGAAYSGMVRSGMTIGDLWNGLDTNKQQRFAEFDGRRARDYQTNRGNAFENWSANLGASRNKFLDEYNIDKDRYAFNAADIDRGNNYRFNTADASFKDALARWTEQVRSLTQLSTPPG